MTKEPLRILRVFPRKTMATPDDPLAFVGEPPEGTAGLDVDEIHVSVTFTADLEKASRLADLWQKKLPTTRVLVGGPACGDPGGEFTPGKYLKPGYLITSRGCPNRCKLCFVPKREGSLRELEVKVGNNLLDNNILACSEKHISEVFGRLKNSSSPVLLTGGLEARRVTDRVVAKLWQLRPNRMFLAYDRPGDLDALVAAGVKLRYADFTRRHCYCYV